MTVQDLCDSLTRLADLLRATDPNSAAARDLTEFVRGTAAFGHLTLEAFLRLAELGAGLSHHRPDPPTLAAEVRWLYDRAADPAVTARRMAEVCGRLGPLTKTALVGLAGELGLHGQSRKKKEDVVAAITGRLLDRKRTVAHHAPAVARPSGAEGRLPPAFARLDDPPLSCDRGLWSVRVPWEERGVVHDFLRSRGCPSTLCLNPPAREAHLVLAPGVDLHRAAELLAELEDEWRRGPHGPG